MFVFILLFFCLVTAKPTSNSTAYFSRRTQLLQAEYAMSIGGNVILNANEAKLNNMLMRLKFEELDYAFNNPQYFNFSHYYFENKGVIKRSRVYQLIRAMPKGAALHVHSSALLGPDYILKITYKDHLYLCIEKEMKFIFAKQIPKADCLTQWQLMKEFRNTLRDVSKFDNELKTSFTLAETNDVNAIWKRFENIFELLYPLLSYEPVWREYLYDVLKEFRNDNIIYVEIRSGIPTLYNIDGKRTTKLRYIQICKEVVDQFVRDYPDFIGAKIIYSQPRSFNTSVIKDSLDLAQDFKKTLPDFIAGYDLIGQEDKGKPLIDFLPELYKAKNNIDYFFHAGETDWFGTQSDENLIDAILLGSKRIGHGYAALKHPLVLEEIKKRNICLEVNVVSNCVLGLTRDTRNHPLASFIAQGLPVILSSDDPGFWDADPLSTDFYTAFIGVSSRKSDLRLLKQLALNSFEYSALSDSDKKKAFKIFEAKWNKFVTDSLALKNIKMDSNSRW